MRVWRSDAATKTMPESTTALGQSAVQHGSRVMRRGAAWLDWLKAHLPDGLRILFIVLPLAVVIVEARRFAVNQRFLDDFMWVPDLVKFDAGQFHFRDLFAAQMEHRIAFPRAIVLLSTEIFGKEIRFQNAITIAGLGIAFLAYCSLLLRNIDRGEWRRWWLPLALMSAGMFCLNQWQLWLWGVLFFATFPVVFLALSVWALTSRWPLSVRWCWCVACAELATLSFAPGVLLWVLPLPLILFADDAVSRKQRWIFAACWAAAFVVMMGLYLHNLHNEAPSAYAYGQGEQETLSPHLQSFLRNPWHDLMFVLTFIGAGVTRGLPCDHLLAARWAAILMLVPFVAAWVIWFRRRKNAAFGRRLLPWLLIGSYSPAVAVMVAVGRGWASEGTGPALNVRYSVHQWPLFCALAVIIAILADEWKRIAGRALPSLVRNAGWAAAGALACLLLIENLYGRELMAAWRATRLQDTAAQLFASIAQPPDFMKRVAGNAEFGAQCVRDLQRLNLLARKPLQTTRLEPFHVKSKALTRKHALFKSFGHDKQGHFVAEGFAMIHGGERAADAIIFAAVLKGKSPRIIGFTLPRSLPAYLRQAQPKDLQFIVPYGGWSAESLASWDSRIVMVDVPRRGSKVIAFALDVRTMELYKLPIPLDNPSAEDAITFDEG